MIWPLQHFLTNNKTVANLVIELVVGQLSLQLRLLLHLLRYDFNYSYCFAGWRSIQGVSWRG
jgi:hypothetical protein